MFLGRHRTGLPSNSKIKFRGRITPIYHGDRDDTLETIVSTTELIGGLYNLKLESTDFDELGGIHYTLDQNKLEHQ